MSALPSRIAAKIDFTSPCWLWTAGKSGSGYGKIRWGDRHRITPAHRVVYEILVGPIPESMDLDHLCRTPACVNPEHLEPVTHQVNMLRGQTVVALHAAKTRCPRGHDYDAVSPKSGKRYCRTCDNAQQRVRRARNRAIVFDGQRYL